MITTNETTHLHPQTELPSINLKGDPEECFYQLGVKDKLNYPQVSQHLLSLINTHSKSLNALLQSGLNILSNNILKNNQSLQKVLNPYCEGLQLSPHIAIKNFLVPEILSSLHTFIPTISPHLFGCSSFFLFDEKVQSTFHGRILDFPLVGTYEKYQRLLSFSLKNRPQIWGYSLEGLPYPSLTGMNSEGITVALHQKFNKKIFWDGNLIFDIAWQILLEGHNPKTVLKILKKNKSISNWGLYLSYKSGEVIAYELFGSELQSQTYNLSQEKLLYFNNLPWNHPQHHLSLIDPPAAPKNDHNNIMPYGIEQYCLMRRNMVIKKLSTFSPKKSLTLNNLFKIMGQPLFSAPTSKSWQMDNITPMTLLSVIMNAHQGLSYYLPGPIPKMLSTSILKIEGIWNHSNPSESQYSLIKNKNAPIPTKYKQGYEFLALAQSAYDQKNYPVAYHSIQMSIEAFEHYAEREIALFYFYLFQYLNFENEKNFPFILENILTLKKKLPPYLQDQCLLLMMRLDKIIFAQTEVRPEDFQFESLRKIFIWEKNLPAFVIKKLRLLTFPQIGILDVIYGYKIMT